jgi:Ricin-type beta-trefoil lectin domain/LGFP repeat
MSNFFRMPFSTAIIAAAMFSNCVTVCPVYADTAYLIHNLKSGLCLDARDPNVNDPKSLTDGTAIQLWDCWGGGMQQWVFGPDGFIRNVKSGLCLDARDPDPGGNNPTSLPDGTAIQLWDCWGGQMQKWVANPNLNLAITNSKSRLCLDARDPNVNDPRSLTDGTAIQLWDCWGGQMQMWYGSLAPLPVNCGPFQVGGLFLVRYLQEPFTQELGCPTSSEIDHPDGGGRYQTFEHGAMAYSPGTGPNSVQIGYSGRGLGLTWSTTEPFSYDKFIVRYDRDGANIGQDEISPQSIPNNSGRWQWSFVDGQLQPGLYRLVVEGCDDLSFNRTQCNQGFSLPVYVRVP